MQGSDACPGSGCFEFDVLTLMRSGNHLLDAGAAEDSDLHGRPVCLSSRYLLFVEPCLFIVEMTRVALHGCKCNIMLLTFQTSITTAALPSFFSSFFEGTALPSLEESHEDTGVYVRNYLEE